MAIDLTKLPLRSLLFAGRPWETGRPVRFAYREGRLWPETPKEPAGEWLVLARPDEPNDGWLRFRKPIVLEWGSWRGKNSWSRQLWALFFRRKGAEITRLLQRLRYDGIVTVRWDRPYQIVNLTGEEVPWVFQTPGIEEKMELFRGRYTDAFVELHQQYPKDDDLLTSPELADLFGQHLTKEGLVGAHQDLWEAWEESTQSPAAQRLCGLLGSLGVIGRSLEGDLPEQRKAGAKDSPLQQLVEHHYAFLQVLLELGRYGTVKAYRGVPGLQIKARWLSVETREATSWSLSLSDALNAGTALGSPIPIERMLLVPGMRISREPRKEVVVLGATDLRNIRWEDPNAKQTGRQTILLDVSAEDWLSGFQKQAQRVVSAYLLARR